MNILSKKRATQSGVCRAWRELSPIHLSHILWTTSIAEFPKKLWNNLLESFKTFIRNMLHHELFTTTTYRYVSSAFWWNLFSSFYRRLLIWTDRFSDVIIWGNLCISCALQGNVNLTMTMLMSSADLIVELKHVFHLGQWKSVITWKK